MKTENLEIEFKYVATVPLSTFHDFCSNINPDKTFNISGYDHFYASKTSPDSMYRHRVGPGENQLTFKRKSTDQNNFVREEHNIDLFSLTSQKKIAEFCGSQGYEYNNSIFKTCFVYNYSYYTLVYYIVYDLEMKELGRFIEIEMKEDYRWTSSFEAFHSLQALERLYKVLGAAPESRVLKSLFEMYKKETK